MDKEQIKQVRYTVDYFLTHPSNPAMKPKSVRHELAAGIMPIIPRLEEIFYYGDCDYAVSRVHHLMDTFIEANDGFYVHQIHITAKQVIVR